MPRPRFARATAASRPGNADERSERRAGVKICRPPLALNRLPTSAKQRMTRKIAIAATRYAARL